MPHIKMILTDDSGTEMSIRSYELSSSLSNLDLIESEIEKFRPQFLGDLTHDLLSSEQEAYAKKKVKARRAVGGLAR